MTIQKHLLTVQEFEQIVSRPENAERRLELIDGELVEMSPRLTHGLTASVVHGEIYVFLKQHPIGRVMFEVDHFMPDDPLNTRRPDVSYISNARLPLERDQFIPFMPDLAVEVKSPTNYVGGKEGLREKAGYYLRNGTRLVWLIYPDSETAEICTLNTDGTLHTQPVPPDGSLNGADVLPGFQLPLRDLFA
jgi:Uma2 family endonuclease